MFHPHAGWVDAEIVVAFPIVHWTMGASGKAAATIGADVAQNAVYTAFAKRTFKRTDHGLG
jgi:hypothetical protein